MRKETRHYLSAICWPVFFSSIYDEDATFGRSWGLKRWLDEHYTMPHRCRCGMQSRGKSPAGGISPYDFSDATVGLFTDRERADGVDGGDLKRWIVPCLSNIARENTTQPSVEALWVVLMALYAIVHHCDNPSKAAVLSPFIYRLKDELLTEIGLSQAAFS